MIKAKGVVKRGFNHDIALISLLQPSRTMQWHGGKMHFSMMMMMYDENLIMGVLSVCCDTVFTYPSVNQKAQARPSYVSGAAPSLSSCGVRSYRG